MSRKYDKSYAGLAALMAENPEKAILRSFGKLNLLNLLFLQAELVHLEDDLNEAAESDNAAFAGEYVTANLMPCTDEALKQQIILFGLQSPHSYDHKLVQRWLERPEMGEQFLTGLDRNAWQDKGDLVCLKLTGNEDPLAKWVTHKLMVWVHFCIGRWIYTDKIVQYSEDWALRLLSLISTVLASVLPVAATVVLYFFQSTYQRLGIIAGFTAVFSFLLSVITNASRSDIFAATAAFAAVQVVFIGTNGPTGTF